MRSRLSTSIQWALTRRGKRGWFSEGGAEFVQGDGGDIGDRHDEVGVAHADGGGLEGVAGGGDGLADEEFVGGAGHADFASGEAGEAHIHADALVGLDVEFEETCAGHDGNDFGEGEALIAGVEGEAPDAVAAHFAFAAVGVEHPHLEHTLGGVIGDEEAVRADPEPSVAEPLSEGGPLGLSGEV